MPEPSRAADVPLTQHGDLPPWKVADMPEPLPFNIGNLFRTIGPGAILLATSIGGGEWLVGPTAGVKHGLSIFWIATVGIVLQTLFNLEGIRYTLYTGEPILTGIMRLRPGSRYWGVLYSLLTVIQLGVPALAVACGSVIFAGLFQTIPGATDANMVLFFVYLTIAMSVALLMFGGTIEKMLERLSWGMIVYIFTFLIFVNIAFVPFDNWMRVLRGFLSFGALPEDNDLLLLGTLAATAGSGGIGNLIISNWFRDKGMGMGKHVGAIGSAVGSESESMSPTGYVFPITDENLRRWKTWWLYARADQVWLWGLGCFVGMFLNVNLATALIPPGTEMEGLKTGTMQAEFLSRHLWAGFWYLALLNGFWILFSTHLGNTDVMVRTVTDALWVSSDQVRARSKGQISRLYYFLLGVSTIWGCLSVMWGSAMELFKFLGFMANIVLGLAAIQVLIVNTTLLPKEIRPPMWRRVALVICAVYYLTFFFLMTGSEVSRRWKDWTAPRPPTGVAALVVDGSVR